MKEIIETNKEILDWAFMDDEDFLFLYLMPYIAGTEIKKFYSRFWEFMRPGIKEETQKTFL